MEIDSKEAIVKIKHMQSNIQNGLNSINLNGNLLLQYEKWKTQSSNSFDSLLYISNPFNLNNPGERQYFDETDPDQLVDLELIRMSVFLSESLIEYENSIFDMITKEKNKQNKIDIINSYSLKIQEILNSFELSACTVILKEFADKQAVLYGEGRRIDIYKSFFSLTEILGKRTLNAIFISFTNWRLTKDKRYFKSLIDSIVDYIQTYYYSYNEDPNLQLYQNMDGFLPIKKLQTVYGWIKLIAFHTEGIFTEYQKKKWLYPLDVLVDNTIITNQISKHSMWMYKTIFQKDDNKTVKQKAKCYQSYGIWIKTTDLIYIVANIFQILSELSEDEIKRYHSTKKETLEYYDNTVKIRDQYAKTVFYHKVFYTNAHKYADYRIIEAFEEDSELFSTVIDDTINIISSINNNSIDELLQAKQRFISSLDNRISDQQKEQIEKVVIESADQIKNCIQKLDIYDELYSSVSKDFSLYATHLIQYPKLFSTLVSAEYLYHTYVEGKPANDRFDYSGISIMYYLSLEAFINTLIYKPYFQTHLLNASQDQWKQYVTHKTLFWDKRNKTYKSSCEIGNLGFLLEEIPNKKPLKDFLYASFNISNYDDLVLFGSKLKDISGRRNNAAHGGSIITQEDTIEDKKNVYDNSREYKGMIFELLSILYN